MWRSSALSPVMGGNVGSRPIKGGDLQVQGELSKNYVANIGIEPCVSLYSRHGAALLVAIWLQRDLTTWRVALHR